MDTSIVQKIPVDSLNYSFIDRCEAWEDYISLGLTAREFKDRSQWYLGKLASKLVVKWGDGSLKKYAKEIGVPYETLKNYRWVVDIYYKDEPNFLPSPKLPFSLYQSVATMPKEKREKFLEQADDNNFSIERARVERKKLEGKKIKPSYKIEFCELHQKWQMWYNNPNEWEEPHR